ERRYLMQKSTSFEGDQTGIPAEPSMSGAIPWPVSAISVSGLYKLSTDQKIPYIPHLDQQNLQSTAQQHQLEQDYPDPDLYVAASEAMSPGLKTHEELRLDVDGPCPQMTASGTITRSLFG